MEKIKNTTMVINAVAKDLALNMADERFRKEMYFTAANTLAYGVAACLNTAAFVSFLRSESETGIMWPILMAPMSPTLAAMGYVIFRMGFNQMKKNYKDTNLSSLKLKETKR